MRVTYPRKNSSGNWLGIRKSNHEAVAGSFDPLDHENATRRLDRCA